MLNYKTGIWITIMAQASLLVTGSNGLVGSKFTSLFNDKYQFDNLDISHPTNPVDITDRSSLMTAFENSSAQAAVHLAAFTDVSRAWQQRGDKQGLAYQVNVKGTANIVDACRRFDKFLIHISTAYVFNGQKSDLYQEHDQPNPIEWYGQTKWEAEQVITNSDIGWTILRIDQPFRSDSFDKLDIAHRIIKGLQQDNLYPMFTNRYHGPTFIDDFTRVLDYFATQQTQGLFHANNGEQWTDYEFAKAIQNIHQLSGKIEPGDLDQYLKTQDRPYQCNTAMSNDKLQAILPFKLNSIQKAIAKIKVDKLG